MRLVYEVSKMNVGMEYLRLLFISSLFFNVEMIRVNTSNESSSNLLEYRLPTEVKCRHYDINITIPSKQFLMNFYEINVRYYIEVHKIIKNISLHYNLQSAANIDTEKIILSATEKHFIPNHIMFSNTTERLVLYFSSEISPGNYILELSLQDKLNNGNLPGFSKVVLHGNVNKDPLIENKIIATNFLWNARKVFPCFDEPSLRATFNISVHHPRAVKVLSNMPIRKEFKKEAKYTHFYTTPPIPTYLVTIMIFTKFESASDNINEYINVWANSTMKSYVTAAHTAAKQFVDYIHKHTEFTKIIPKIDHVVVPPDMLMTKSSWGLYVDSVKDIEPHEKLNINEQFEEIEYLAAQKLAQQWYSNVVSPDWWNYLWLTDGIAKFNGLYLARKVFKQTRVMDLFVVKNLHQALSEDVKSQIRPVMDEIKTSKEIDMLFSITSQNKMVALIRMMYHLIPDKVFHQAINQYISENLFRSVSPDDLWKAMRKALNDSNIKQDEWDIEKVMSGWLTRSNYPVLNVAHYPELQAVVFYRENLYNQGNTRDIDYTWWIPVTYATKSKPYFNKTLPDIWLTPITRSLQINNIPKDDWVIFNLQQTGYYRVNYDEKNWRKLINFLNSRNYTKIHAINRAQLIDDCYHLMKAGLVNYDIFLDLTSYLKQETDYIPWYPMKAIISDMSIYFKFPESVHVRLHMLYILHNKFNGVQYENEPDTPQFQKLLKLLVLKLACELGQLDCMEAAHNKLNTYLENPDAKIHPAWTHWTFCSGMMLANESTLTKMLVVYNRYKDYNYLKYLNCIENESLIVYLINKLISYKIQTWDEQHRLRIIQSILKKHLSKDQVLRYVLNNYENIKKFSKLPLLDFITMHIYQKNQFDMLMEFVNNNYFSKIEMDTHTFFKEYHLNNIKRQFDKIETERMLFVTMFNID